MMMNDDINIITTISIVFYSSSSTTVKPLMFVCPLFGKYCELVKLDGANVDIIPTLIGIGYSKLSQNCEVRIFPNKWHQNNSACEITTFRAAKLKGFYSTSRREAMGKIAQAFLQAKCPFY